jgi:nicotinamide mononucleotide transporter
MDMLDFLQWLAFGMNMLFIVLITANKKIGWLFGIIAAAVSTYIFYQSNLVSEAFLNAFYVVMGVYGWMYWSKTQGKSKKIPVIEYKWLNHIVLVLASVGLALLMGKINQYNAHAAVPYADAFSTSFAFMATFLEARKVLSGWIYWIAINLYSIWLYGQKTMADHDLTILQIQMAVFALFSVIGFLVWRKKWDGSFTRISKSNPAQD